MATAARNSAKAAGDVIGGSPKQANGAIAVLALIAGRNNLQIATAVRGRNAVRVQCSAVRWLLLLRCLERYGGTEGRKGIWRACAGSVLWLGVR